LKTFNPTDPTLPYEMHTLFHWGDPNELNHQNDLNVPNETDETDGRDKKSERIEQRSYSRIREVNSVDTTPKLGGPCNRGGGNTIAHRELKELVEKGVFRKKGAGKYIRYELTQG